MKEAWVRDRLPSRPPENDWMKAQAGEILKYWAIACNTGSKEPCSHRYRSLYASRGRGFFVSRAARPEKRAYSDACSRIPSSTVKTGRSFRCRYLQVVRSGSVIRESC